MFRSEMLVPYLIEDRHREARHARLARLATGPSASLMQRLAKRMPARPKAA
jgi:hypothetical protein